MVVFMGVALHREQKSRTFVARCDNKKGNKNTQKSINKNNKPL